MKRYIVLGFALSFYLAAPVAWTATRYVNKANPLPQPPFASGWASAATNIQDAIDVAVDGDLILVTNGVYDSGGTMLGDYYSRVNINKAITVKAVSPDPADTVIVGAPDPDTGGCGPNAMRGVCITPVGSSIVGFTIRGGYTKTVGHVNNTSLQYGGGISYRGYSGSSGYGIVSNCVISGNVANQGGGGIGARNGTMTFYNCIISGNTASGAGGSHGGSFNDCEIFSNTAYGTHGGVSSATCSRCKIWGNTAGGSAGGGGNGAFYSCLIYGNSAGGDAGGVTYGVLMNSTIVGNYASGDGGASYYSFFTNCIVWGNNAPGANKENRSARGIDYSCVKAGVAHGVNGNITNEPMFIAYGTGYGLAYVPGDNRLEKDSPCVDTGINQDWMINERALNRCQRIVDDIVDMGANEYLWRGTIFSTFGDLAP